MFSIKTPKQEIKLFCTQVLFYIMGRRCDGSFQHNIYPEIANYIMNKQINK